MWILDLVLTVSNAVSMTISSNIRFKLHINFDYMTLRAQWLGFFGYPEIIILTAERGKRVNLFVRRLSVK